MKRIASLGCSMLTIALLLPINSRMAYAQSTPGLDEAYTAFYIEENIPKKNALMEQFLKDFKDSKDLSAETYRETAYKLLFSDYSKANEFAKMMDLADKTEQLIPSASAALKANGYSQGMTAAQQTNNVAKTLAFGDKVLAAKPDDGIMLNTLSMLSSTIPAALPPDPAAQRAALEKADQYATQALAISAKLDPKTLGMTAAEWAKQRPGIEGTLHTTLGGNAYTRTNYEKAVEELTIAVKDTPKNDLAWYQMGLAQSQQAAALSKKVQDGHTAELNAIKAKADKNDIDDLKAINGGLIDAYHAKLDEAIASLATAVACAGPYEAPTRAQLERLWKQAHNSTTDGMEDFIKSKKQP